MSTNETVLFVDADNQPVSILEELSTYLRAMSQRVSRIVIAGNGAGAHVKAWEADAKSRFPASHVTAYVTPVRKQAADAWLLFQIGRMTADPQAENTSILIISRDDILVAAAEQLVCEGFMATLAMSDATPAPETRVPCTLLSCGGLGACIRSTGIDLSSPDAIRAYLQQELLEPGRRCYSPNEVGRVLADLGLNKKQREHALRVIPGIEIRGEGQSKVIVFA